MRSRANALETAILGLLSQSPLHGYELRKRLNLVMGSLRALSYGSVYPALKSLLAKGLIEVAESDGEKIVLASRRSRIVYQLTELGRERLKAELRTADPASWEDEEFGVRFALFGVTDVPTRLRVLEGRRSRLAERLQAARQGQSRAASLMDEYGIEWQRHSTERIERELVWLDELISNERGRASGTEPEDSGPAEDADGHTADESTAIEKNTQKEQS